MAAIYLIRHGQASFHKDDYDQLSDLGFQQAKRLGNIINQKFDSVSLVLSGSMRRHQQTANTTLNEIAHLDINTIETQPLWNEFDHENVMKAYNPEWPTTAIFRQHINRQENPEKTFLNLFHQAISRWIASEHNDYLESWPQFKQRIDSGLSKLVENLPDKGTALVFTSGGPIAYLSQRLLGIPETNLLNTNKSLVNCGVTKIIVSGGRLILSSLNEHSAFESSQHQHLVTYK